MDREKIIGIALGVALAIIVIVLIIVGVLAFKSKKATNENSGADGTIVQSNAKGDGGGTIQIGQLDIPQSSSKKKKMMEGYEVIGVLEIPKTGLKTNILAETTKKTLEIAVSQIYTTGALNKPGNTVIYGHNYRNTLFFSRNDELEIGDKFYITDEETHNKMEYKITEKFETTATDTSFYTRSAEDTLGKVEVTLSTCTDDADKTDRRLIIRGVETE